MRIYPTLRWIILFIVCCSLMFAAINYHKNSLHWLAYAFISFLIISTVSSWIYISKINWKWTYPEYIYAGDSFIIESNKNEFGRLKDELGTLPLNITAKKVGTLEFKNLHWCSEYPFGLLYFSIKLPDVPQIWVYPKPINHLNDSCSSITQSEWTDLKNYQHGDNLKRITKKSQTLEQQDWKVISEDFSDSQKTKIKLDIDLNSYPKEWSKEKKLEQLSFDISELSLTQEFSIKFPDTDLYLESGHGIEHKHKAWKMITLIWNM